MIYILCLEPLNTLWDKHCFNIIYRVQDQLPPAFKTSNQKPSKTIWVGLLWLAFICNDLLPFPLKSQNWEFLQNILNSCTKITIDNDISNNCVRYFTCVFSYFGKWDKKNLWNFRAWLLVILQYFLKYGNVRGKCPAELLKVSLSTTPWYRNWLLLGLNFAKEKKSFKILNQEM